jgi:uncharacterized protein (UPF0332 family)
VLKQKKGISIVDENENLMNAYFKKAENAIRAVRNEKDNFEWEISAGYYVYYFSSYAILMRLGIKCEIHSCTICLVKFLLENKFTQEEINLFNKAKDLRIRVQYYVSYEKEIKDYSKITKKAIDFFYKCQEICQNLTSKEVEEIREKLKNKL